MLKLLIKMRYTSKYQSETTIGILLLLGLILAPPAFAQTAVEFTGTSWSEFIGGAKAVCADTDRDNDNDGLIELCYLEDVDAIRHQLDGSGYRSTASATLLTTGCGGGESGDTCFGYELVRNLDFDANDSYRNTANKIIWTNAEEIALGEDFPGFPTIAGGFSGTLEGNGHGIAGLFRFSDNPTEISIGFFENLSASGRIQNLGLSDIVIEENRSSPRYGILIENVSSGTIINCYLEGILSSTGGSNPGIIAGVNSKEGKIFNTYGSMEYTDTFDSYFVDTNKGRISDSYFYQLQSVTLKAAMVNLNQGKIVNIYASGGSIRKMVNDNRGPNAIRNSYSNNKGLESPDDPRTFQNVIGFSETELQNPTGPGTTSTAPYYTWSEKNWDFGTVSQYPVLKYARGNDASKQACGTSQQPKCGNLLSQRGIAERLQRKNARPVIQSPTNGTKITVPKGTAQTISVTVSDDDIHDDLSILLSEVGVNEAVDLVTTRVMVPPNTNSTRDPVEDLKIRVKTGTAIGAMTQLKLVATDDSNLPNASSREVLLDITVGAEKFTGESWSEFSVKVGEEVKEGAKAVCDDTDIDNDDDGLIELCYLEDLNAIRHQLKGSAYQSTAAAPVLTVGCGGRLGECFGYELVRDLDFNEDDSYRNATENKSKWTTGEGWLTIAGSFSGTLEGNSYRIANLFINREGFLFDGDDLPDPSERDNNDSIGFFEIIDAEGRIQNLGLWNINVQANQGSLSVLVSDKNRGTIINCYIQGKIGRTPASSQKPSGTMAITNLGKIFNSYISIVVDPVRDNISELFVYENNGERDNQGEIANSYINSVSGTFIRVLEENARLGNIRNMYIIADNAIDFSRFNRGPTKNIYMNQRDNENAISYFSGMDLRNPTGPGTTSTAPYYTWSEKNWDFGTVNQYPVLKYVISDDDTEDPANPVCGDSQQPKCGSFLRGQNAQPKITYPLNNAQTKISQGEERIIRVVVSDTDINDGLSVLLSAVNENTVVELVTTYTVVLSNDKVAREEAVLKIRAPEAATIGGMTQLKLVATDDSGLENASSEEVFLEVTVVEENTLQAEEFTGTSWSEFSEFSEVGGIKAVCDDTDRDNDNDGLIELCYLEDVNAIRHQLDGSGYQSTASAPVLTTGCGGGAGENECFGYELVRDLDFDEDDSYSSIANKIIWTTGEGWLPIEGVFRGTLEGNGHSISNLLMDKTDNSSIGFFENIAAKGRIQNLGLLNVNITSIIRDRTSVNYGVLVSEKNKGTIINCYVQGEIENYGETIINFGAIAKENTSSGKISNTYANIEHNSGLFLSYFNGTNKGIISDSYLNGSGAHSGSAMIRKNKDDGNISNIYTVFKRIRRIVNDNLGSASIIENSYSNRMKTVAGTQALRPKRNEGSVINVIGFRTRELRKPIGPGMANTAPYYDWSKDNWDFGTAKEYPILKYAIGDDENLACGTSQQPVCKNLLPAQGDRKNARPEIISPSNSTLIAVPKDNEDHTISVTVSDRDIDDELTVLLSVVDDEVIDLVTTRVMVPPNTNITRDPVDLKIRVPETAEIGAMTQLRLLATDDSGFTNKRSDEVLLEIIAGELNTSPTITISPSAEQTMQLGDKTSIVVSVEDDNYDVEDRVTVSAMSSDAAVTVAPSEIAEIADNTNRTFTLTAAQAGNATITFTATDSKDASSREVLSVTVTEETFTGTSWSEFSDEDGAKAVCDDGDRDNDNDGLIELCYLEDVYAIRHQLDGSGYRSTASATLLTTGCGGGESGDTCFGYELVRDLDFNENDSYSSTPNKVTWTTGAGWLTIAGDFSGTLEGNGYRIANLFIDRDGFSSVNSGENNEKSVGFFGDIGDEGRIQNLGLWNVNVQANEGILSVLVSNENDGTIINCYIQGEVRQNVNARAGLMVTDNNDEISNSYVSVKLNDTISAIFVDVNNREIANSYASGSGGDSSEVMKTNSFGASILNMYLVADNPVVVSQTNIGSMSNIYANKSSFKAAENNIFGTPKNVIGFTTMKLQEPTGPGTTSTAPYYTWSEDDWDFGTASEYPALKHAKGDDPDNNPACGDSQQPLCGSLLRGQRDAEANTTPTITISPSAELTMQLGSTASIVVRVSDGNFDVGDLVTVSATTAGTSVTVEPAEIAGIAGNTTRTFTLRAVRAGSATITFTATDSKDASTSTSVLVHVNTPPSVVNVPTQVATVEQELTLDTSEFFEDADGDALSYSITTSGIMPDSLADSLANGFDTTNGMLTFTPPLDAEASTSKEAGQTVTVSVDDDRGGSATATFTLLINAEPELNDGVSIEVSGNIEGNTCDTWLLCAKSTVTDANGIADTTYQWYRNNGQIEDATSATYTIQDNHTGRAAGTIYRVDVTFVDNIGQSVTLQSNRHTVDNEKPVIARFDAPTMAVDEGSPMKDIRVNASDANHDSLKYTWRVKSGATEVLTSTNTNPARLSFPTDLVDAATTTTELILEVEVSDGMLSTKRTVSVVVNKVNNGQISAGTLSRSERTLTLPLSNIDRSGETDGGVNGDVAYQWQQCLGGADCSDLASWTDIGTESVLGDSEPSYTVLGSVNDNDRFRVKLTYTDGQGYDETVYSSSLGPDASSDINTTPTITITSLPSEAIEPNSTASIVVRVEDENYDVGDLVIVRAVSSTPSVVRVTPKQIDEIKGNMDQRFVIHGGVAGESRIQFTATDSEGTSTSASVLVHVNTPPKVTDNVPAQIATIGQAFTLKTSEFFEEDADGDTYTYSITTSGITPNSLAARLANGFSSTGTLTFTPIRTEASTSAAGQTVTVSVSDGRGGSATVEFKLLIDAEPAGGVSVDDDSDNRWLLRAESTVTDANGIADTTYQWYRGHRQITGETAATYTIPDDPIGRAGDTTYWVEVTFVDNIGQSVTLRSNVYVIFNEKPVITGFDAPTMAVDEGSPMEDIRVIASDVNHNVLTYRWNVKIGDTRVLTSTNTNPATLDFPTDLVVGAATTATTLILEVEVIDGEFNTTGTVSVVVKKKNNGQISVESLSRSERTLTLPLSNIDRSGETDGGVNGGVAYQWQQCLGGTDCSDLASWTDIGTESVLGDSEPSYTVLGSVNDNDRFRVKLTYTDGQGYDETVYSSSLGPDASSDIKIRSKVFLEGPLQ